MVSSADLGMGAENDRAGHGDRVDGRNRDSGICGASPYAACSAAPDPPRCLVERAAPDGDSADDLLEGIIFTGSVGLIEPVAAKLTGAAQEKALSTERFLKALGITLPPDAASVQAKSASDSVALAAVALAAAAQNSDDPFADAVVARLLARANNTPLMAEVAATLWNEADTYSQWSGYKKVTRPRGMPVILKAIIAAPPSDNDTLIDIANNTNWVGYADEGLALLRIATARSNLSAENKIAAASILARRYHLADEAQRVFDSGAAAATGYDVSGVKVELALARLYQGYDAAAAKLAVEACLARFGQEAFYSYLGHDEINALEAANARKELAVLGDAYLARARKGGDDAEGRGEWFALASESYRGAGNRDAALAAAREGLPFVQPAVAARVSTRPDQKPEPITDKRAAAVQASGFGTAPVIALYRAGAREEALATGFLTGYDHYFQADVAGEGRDPIWVLEDNSASQDELLEGWLVDLADKAGAERAYIYLRCHDIYGSNLTENLNEFLGILAALGGRRKAMSEHFARAAQAVDAGGTGATPATKAWAAFRLAADWRRGLTIAQRIGATDTTFPDEACTK